MLTTIQLPDTFAANRATGTIALAVAAEEGKTRRARVHEAGSLRIRFPNAGTEALEGVIVNTGGGMTGGDRFAIDIALGEGAQMVVTTAAAEKIYRSTGPDAELNVAIKVADGGRLCWLPQETILFDRARLSRRIDIDLAATGSLLVAEAVIFGRAAMNETVREGRFADRWRLKRGGRLVYADSVRLDGAIADTLACPAVTHGGVAIATVLIAPGGEAELAAVRAREPRFAGEASISAWNGVAVARLCARDGAMLRHDLIEILTGLGAAVPRSWLQ